MVFRRILPIAIIFLAIIGFWRSKNFCVENKDYTYQNGWQGSFDVKAERIPETCSFGAHGANYVFSARQRNSENWRGIMTFRHSDVISVSGENIHIVNEKVAFIFIGWKAAVTFDAGKSWNLWDAKKDLSNWESANYGLINKINMSENGVGNMILNPIPGRDAPNELFTADFGKTWKQTK